MLLMNILGPTLWTFLEYSEISLLYLTIQTIKCKGQRFEFTLFTL